MDFSTTISTTIFTTIFTTVNNLWRFFFLRFHAVNLIKDLFLIEWLNQLTVNFLIGTYQIFTFKVVSLSDLTMNHITVFIGNIHAVANFRLHFHVRLIADGLAWSACR